MVKVEFPALVIPSTIKRGCLLDVSLFGVGLVIPPMDIKLFGDDIVVWEGFTLFDTDDIVNGVAGLGAGFAESVWNMLEDVLQEMVDDYYGKSEEEEA